LGFHFRRFKDLAILPLDGLVKMATYLPDWAGRSLAASFGLFFKSFYFLPGSHLRRTAVNLCRVIGHPDPRAMYFQIADKLASAAVLYGMALGHGSEVVADATTMDEVSYGRCREVLETRGSGMAVTTHCVGSVLAGPFFGREFPSRMLMRESKSETRARISRRYFERLGMNAIYARRADPVSLARGILRAFKQGALVVGTADLARRTEDTVQVEVFGQPVWLPAWPSRFAARRDVPILPLYVRVEGERIVMTVDEPFDEKDLVVSTQRWASSFEQSIRAHPADWVFMFDKHWSRIIAAAAAQLD
jgi:KDO2-lipid IV(A) lauroyltransferase